MHQDFDEDDVTGEYTSWDTHDGGSNLPWCIFLLISVIGFAAGWYTSGNGG